MKVRGDGSFVDAYKYVYGYLESQGYKPTLNFTDNKFYKAVKNYVSYQDVNWQLVEPDNHQLNEAKRSIQTFKNNFITGLRTVDPKNPLQLWCYLLAHAEMTLNMLQTLRVDLTKSAYEVL